MHAALKGNPKPGRCIMAGCRSDGAGNSKFRTCDSHLGAACVSSVKDKPCGHRCVDRTVSLCTEHRCSQRLADGTRCTRFAPSNGMCKACKSAMENAAKLDSSQSAGAEEASAKIHPVGLVPPAPPKAELKRAFHEGKCIVRYCKNDGYGAGYGFFKTCQSHIGAACVKEVDYFPCGARCVDRSASLCTEHRCTQVINGLRCSRTAVSHRLCSACKTLKKAAPTGAARAPAAAPVAVAKKPSKKFAYDVFLSHKQATGGDAVAILQKEFASKNLRCWFDRTTRHINVDAMLEGVRDSAVFLLFLSKGVFSSQYVMLELQEAIENGKPIILVHDPDEGANGCSLSELINADRPQFADDLFSRYTSHPFRRKEYELKALVTELVQCIRELSG